MNEIRLVLSCSARLRTSLQHEIKRTADNQARMEEHIRENAGDDIDVDALVHYLFNTEPAFDIARNWLTIRPKHQTGSYSTLYMDETRST